MEDGVGKQALYRRYRSTSFAELVGQEHVTELLEQAIAGGAISHAYLFTGQKGTGKTSAARILAYAINKLPYDTESSHLDIIEIDAASNRRIDDIRDLREKVHIAPVSAQYKVYIIDEVHMLTGESFNALLKTLEEPPAHVVFILATTELHKVPATIISRVQRFHFRPVSRQKVSEHLKAIATKEGIDIDDDALGLVAEYGGGSFRDSIGLLDQLSGLKRPIDTALVENILGRASGQIVTDIIAALMARNTQQVRQLIEEVIRSGISPNTLSEQLVAAVLSRPDNTYEWYELAETLMTVPKAHFAQLLLTSTLLRFVATHDQTPRTPAATPETPLPTPADKLITQTTAVAEQPTEIVPNPSVSDAETISGSNINDRPNDEVESENPETTPSATSEFNWQSILDIAKKNNAPLYSVLTRAAEKHTDTAVTLAFPYALHRKKMKQAQYKTQLAKLILDVTGTHRDILIADTPQLETDTATASVAEVMGGGEVVIL